MHCTKKWDTDADYLDKFRLVLLSHMSTIDFADPANIRKAHKELMS